MGEIIEPTVAAMAKRGTPFKGVLFAGLMITAEGPKLIEYNVRFGDPETQVLMMRLKSDLLPALLAAGRRRARSASTALARRGGADRRHGGQRLSRHAARTAPRSGVSRAAAAVEGVEIFHAGTRRDGDRILADGGRVLNVTARGKTVAEAQARAYAAVARIDWPGGFYRRDIGWRAVEREKART